MNVTWNRSLRAPLGSALAASFCALGLLAQAAVAQEAASQDAASVADVEASVDPWPLYRGDRGLRGVASGSLEADLELWWSFATEGAIVSSAVVGRHGDEGARTVYFGSSDGYVYALDFATGSLRWKFKTDDIIDAPPLLLDGRLYIGSSDFFFYCLEAASGDLVWKHETGDKILGGANWLTLPDGSKRVVVGSYDSRLYGFDAKTGTLAFTYETGNYINGTPAILDGNALFGGCDAVLHTVSLTTGEATSQIALGNDCHVAGSVAVVDGHVYFGHYGNEFIRVDPAAEDVVWGYPNNRHPFFSSPSITADRVVFGGRDKRVHCVQRDTGTPLWTFRTRRKVDGSPLVVGDKVVVGSGDGRVYMLALEDGSKLWEYDLGRSVFSSPAVVDGVLLIGGNDGSFYAFRAPDEE